MTSAASLPPTAAQRGFRWLGPEGGLAAALVLLAALRFVGLGSHGLWLDEALTLSDALHQPVKVNPLGYRLCAWFYGLLAARPDELLLRLPAAVAGALSLGLCVFAFSPWAGRRGALVAALFLGSSSWHLYWSQSARFYTMAQCAVLLGTGILLRARGTAERPYGSGRAFLQTGLGLLVAASGMGFHPTALLVIPGLFLALQVLSDSSGLKAPLGARRLLWALALLSAALLVPWAWERVSHWRAVKGQGSPLHLVLTSGFYFGPVLLSAALVAAGLWWRRRYPGVSLALCVVFSSLCVALLLSFQVRVTAQYVFVVLPFVCLLAAAPWCLATPGRQQSLPGATAYGVLTLVSLPALIQCGLFLTHRNGERPHWREAYSTLAREVEPQDLLMGMSAPVGEYYLNPLATRVRNPQMVVYLDQWRSEVPQRWDRTGRRTWFVVNFEELDDWQPAAAEEFRRTLSEDCRLVAAWPLEVESRDLSVYLFVRDG